MSGPRPNPFEPLEPPRGGLATLRARIERDSTRRVVARRAWSVAAVAVMAVVAAGVLMLPRPGIDAGAIPGRFGLAGMRVGLVDLPDEPVTVAANRRHLVAVQRVPLSDDSVVFYRVASVAEADEDDTLDAP